MSGRGSIGERGFTLAEVVIATFIISIGLVAVAVGFQFATSGIAVGRGETIAAFLAEQRLEQLKASAITNYDGLVAGAAVTENCLPSNIGTTGVNCQVAAITGGQSYIRVTTITDNPGGTGCTGGIVDAGCKRIQVSVRYRPVTSRGDSSQTRSVDLYALVVRRT